MHKVVNGQVVELSQAEEAAKLAEWAAWDALDHAAIATAKRHQTAKTLLHDPEGERVLLRAGLIGFVTELNILRQRDVDRAADVAAATSFADLKTRWAAHPALNARTLDQLKEFIENKIDSGDAD